MKTGVESDLFPVSLAARAGSEERQSGQGALGMEPQTLEPSSQARAGGHQGSLAASVSPLLRLSAM